MALSYAATSRLSSDELRFTEHIDRHGRLVVPVERWLEPTPAREGWTPWWVNVNLAHPIQKVVTYKPVSA